ncbi:Hypp8609 [Branchiostoma lanceolatum]|uniref:ferroxidase n=1 Tax=Branchiostoma lanceolatum TaxID=7740 RepID=A0A8J9Z7V9_BRALA|nr:Hypp8609 [Branchiostoma lanceolatum]
MVELRLSGDILRLLLFGVDALVNPFRFLMTQSSEMNLLRTLIITWICVSMATAEMCTDDVCEFTLIVRRARTMTHTGSDGKVNGVEILRNGSLQVKVHVGWAEDTDGPIVPVEETITADGVQRNVILVNDQFPGPTLEVMEGAQVVLKVINHFYKDVASLHVHGMYMRGANHMDGVPYVTEYPILPGKSFSYRFKAEPAGTHWYHSHVISQKEDGMFGAFIVHRNRPSAPAMPLFVHDWWHEEFLSLDVDSWYMRHRGPGRLFGTWFSRGFSFDGVELTAVHFTSALINGRGRYNGNNAPLTKFTISSGGSLRFRMIHSGAEFTFRVSIDAHSMTVVANDGHDVESVQVQSIIIYPGESYDFEVLGNQPNGVYWIRAETLWSGRGPNFESKNRTQEVRAILAYQYASSDEDPTTTKPTCSEENPCRVLNCPFPAFPAGSHTECIYMSDINATADYSPPDDSDIVECFFTFGYIIGASINARKFAEPNKPLVFGEPYDVVTCDQSCETNGCKCTYIVDIPANKNVRFVMINTGDADESHHSIHLHGYDFRVLAMGFPLYNKTTDIHLYLFTGHWLSANPDIDCGNDKCSNARWRNRPTMNLNRPPVRDTVVVPANGYTVIEFRSNNPGHWIFHCHQTTHMNEGMAMVIREAPGNHPNRHPGLPTSSSGGTGHDSQPTSEPTAIQLSVPVFIVILVAAVIGSILITLAMTLLWSSRRQDKEAAEEQDHPKEDTAL